MLPNKAGSSSSVVQTTKDKHIPTDLSKLSTAELTEVIDRQNKLLSRRAFIEKLPDRGERIKHFKKQLDDEMRKRANLTDMCQIMSGLTINGKELSENLEWSISGKGKPPDNTLENSSDNEEMESNPLKIIASHSGAGFHRKIYRQEEEPESLIKPSDLVIDGEKNNESETPMYVEALCTKFDSSKSKERFLPFKTLVREKELKNNKVRDVTAASPPVTLLNQVKQMSLQESLRLQAEQAQHLLQVQYRHAAERLKEKGAVQIGDVLPPIETTAHYRESPPSDSEEEILDEAASEEPGGVTFPLANS